MTAPAVLNNQDTAWRTETTRPLLNNNLAQSPLHHLFHHLGGFATLLCLLPQNFSLSCAHVSDRDCKYVNVLVYYNRSQLSCHVDQ